MGSSVPGVCVSFAAVLLCAPLAAQVTQRVSVTSAGAEIGTSSRPGQVSADGRFVVFESDAKSLVTGDTNGVMDVFVRDLQSGVTERVSITTSGAQVNRASSRATISADGRYVAFLSEANDLVPEDTNGVDDVFVRDRFNLTTRRVSVDSQGVQADAASHFAQISEDGRFVAFSSSAANLVPGDTNGFEDVFVRDRESGLTERVSVDTNEVQGSAPSGDLPSNVLSVSISADGRFVVFVSIANDLVAGDTNGARDIFLRDRQAGTTERVSVLSGGAQSNNDSYRPSISADGRFVAFDSVASNLVAGDVNGVSDVFVRDRQAGTTERVSLDSGGIQGNDHSYEPSISSDGRTVVFESLSSNLVTGDTNGARDVFLRDRLSAATGRASVDSGGSQGDGDSTSASISNDGRSILFSSLATNLVPGDTNGSEDLFLRALGAGGTGMESGGLGGAPANGASSGPAISCDARFVTFESSASNLVATDVNGARDVFLRDRQAGATVLASVDTAGVQANGDSFRPDVSSDGRFVAFDSVATNLVGADANAASDVFVRDLVGSTTERVSVDGGGAEANGDCFDASISEDGRFVAFDSAGSNLVAGDTNLSVDVFLRDRQTGTTVRVSVDSAGVQGATASSDPSISADGRFVAFASDAPNLVAGDTNGATDVFVRDLQTGTTTRWSVGPGGAEANGNSSNPAISDDGLHVAFESDATNLVPGDTNLSVDVFVRHGPGGGVTDRVSVDSGGTQGATASFDPSISTDGRFVAFASTASNLVPGDTNGSLDVFVNDRLTGATTRVSVDSAGTQGATASGGPDVSCDGRLVAFDSSASNLVPGDTNGLQDVFLRDTGSSAAFVTFCFGDGSGGSCPCANFGDAGHGCDNSDDTGGAVLTVTGTASFAADTVQFTSTGEKPTALSIFLQGDAVISPVTYGDGIRCTGGALKRLYAKSAVGGIVSAPLQGDLSVSARSAFLNAPIPLGATRVYQVYYRDVNPSTFCPTPQGSNFNASNGMLVAWGG